MGTEKLKAIGRRVAGTAHGQAGFALPAVLIVMMLVATIVFAGLLTSGDERLASRALRDSGRSFYAAHAGANVVIANWQAQRYDTLAAAPGDSFDLGWQTLDNGYKYRAVVRRVDGGSGNRLYAITSTGRGPHRAQGQRVLTVFMAAKPVKLGIPGAVTLLDGGGADPNWTSWVGNSFRMQGRDTEMPSAATPANIPSGCPTSATGDNYLGVSLNSGPSASELADAVASGQEDQINGLLPGSTTNQYTDLSAYGYNNGAEKPYDFTRDYLTELVEGLKPYATVVPNGNYNSDFGSPTNPGVWIGYDHVGLMGSGRGYGIMISEKSISIGGSYTWEGLIIVIGEGRISVGGPGATVFGAAIAANTLGGRTELAVSGNGMVNYSSQAICRVEQLITKLGLGPVGPLANRSWHQEMN